jgi:acid phosphatase (class A)
MKKWIALLFLLMLLAADPAAAAHKVQMTNPGAVPDSLAFLPPPPAEGSIDFRRDQEVYQETRELKGTARWEQSAFDADRRGHWTEYFLDAFGMQLTKEKTPVTYELVSKTFGDLNEAAESAKNHYNRVRPFVYYNVSDSTCMPKDEKRFSENGSYPSGHSAYGWGLALILAEISPERQSALLKRGYDFGFNRVICGVHWPSDVEAGRCVAAAVVAQMHNNSVFIDLLAKAKAEIQAIRKTTTP